MIASLWASFKEIPVYYQIALAISAMICFYYGLYVLSGILIKVLKKIIILTNGPEELKTLEQQLKARGHEI